MKPLVRIGELCTAMAGMHVPLTSKITFPRAAAAVWKLPAGGGGVASNSWVGTCEREKFKGNDRE